jgi:membrane fusion protein, multidrug efflux system
MTCRVGVPQAGDEEAETGFRGNSASCSSTRLRFLLPLVLIFCWMLAGCAGGDPKSGAARANVNQPVPVSVSIAERQDMPYYLTGLGSVSAFYTDSIKTRVDGELVEVNFKEGQFVNKGDLLVVIDPRPYQVALEQAQATLFRDQASLRDAKLNFERYKGLLQNSGAMSQQQVDTQGATVDQLEGAVRTDQAAIDSAKLNLVYCHIASPISGRVGLRLVDPGNIVHATDTNPLLIVTQLQPIAVLFTLPEDQLPTVAQHMAKNNLQVDAYSRDDQTKLTSGKLLTIDNQIDQTTGTGRLKAVFDNKENALWPNQFVNVHLLLEIRKNSTVIPSAAIQRGPQGTYVFVAKPDHTAEIKPVTIAFVQENLANVSNGVSPGDVVITDGQDKLQDGSPIQVRTPAAPAGQSQSAGSSQNSPASSGAQPSSRNAGSSGK